MGKRVLKGLLIAGGLWIVVVVLLIVLGSSGSSSGPKSLTAHDLVVRIARGEACYRSIKHRYTSDFEDLNLIQTSGLVPLETRQHLTVQLSVGDSGQDYYTQVIGAHRDDFIQVTPTLVNEGRGGVVSLACDVPRAKVIRALRYGIPTSKIPH